MITQAEADFLIAMEKMFKDPDATIFIPPGTDQSHELIGDGDRDLFLLDIWRARRRVAKIKYQTRSGTTVILVRLDVNSSPHTNPDGTIIGRTHIHIYSEDHEDKWAYPINSSEFPNPSDILNTLEDFCRYCNIQDLPTLQRGLL